MGAKRKKAGKRTLRKTLFLFGRLYYIYPPGAAEAEMISSPATQTGSDTTMLN